MSKKNVPHSRPTIGDEEVKAVSAVISTGHIAQGRKVEELEEKLAEYFGVKGAVVTSSGTSALHLGLIALGTRVSDEIILPSYVCTSPLNAVYMSGGIPVLCDIELESFNICPEDLKERITEKTKAIIVPHMFGSPADIGKISEMGIKIIEDCAHSAGAFYGSRKIGSLGELSMISFYANKIIAAGEGGAVLSNNNELLKTVKDLRDYDEKESYKVRYNYKMTDIQAAMGVEQLSKLDDFIERRKELAAVYDDKLKAVNAVLPKGEFDHIYYRYVLRLEKEVSNVIELLALKGVNSAKPVFKPLHRYFEMRAGFKKTDEAFSTSLSIPIYPSLTDREQEQVIKALIEILE